MGILASLERLMSRASLKYQIGAIGAVAILGFVTIMGFYFSANRSVDQIQAVADRASSANARMTEIEILMLEARRAEKDFLLRRDAKYAGRQAEVMQSAERSFEALGQVLDQAEHRALATDAQKLARSYTSSSLRWSRSRSRTA